MIHPTALSYDAEYDEAGIDSRQEFHAKVAAWSVVLVVIELLVAWAVA